MRALLPALVAAVATQNQIDFPSHPSLPQLLNRTVWMDIGLGQNLNALTPKQIAELRKCPEPMMAFQLSGGSWVQSFYAGIEMRTTYSSATIKSDPAGSTVLFYMAGHSEPAETLHVAQSGDVLVEQTHGFRAHTFLKCVERKETPSKGRSR